MAFIKGLLLGMSTMVFLGPVFFTLLKNSMQKGYVYGLYTAFGILISDIIVVLICYSIAADYISQYVGAPITKFIAASILITLGTVFFFNPINEPESNTQTEIKKGYLPSFIQGFIVNFFNPTVFLVWIGFLALGQSLYASSTDFYIYIASILLGIFITDSIKAVASGFLAPYIRSSYLSNAYKVIGIFVIGFGISLVYKGICQFM